MIKLAVQFDKSIQPFGQEAVTAVIKALDQKLQPADITIGLRVVSADQVRQFNKKYAGKDQPTDVLSFNYAEGALAPGEEKAGDIVISYQHVHDQARQAKTSAETELALLALHGTLHILGYDHQNLDQRNDLNALQSEIMKAAGLRYRNFAWKD